MFHYTQQMCHSLKSRAVLHEDHVAKALQKSRGIPSNQEAAYKPYGGACPDQDDSKNQTKYGACRKAQHRGWQGQHCTNAPTIFRFAKHKDDWVNIIMSSPQ